MLRIGVTSCDIDVAGRSTTLSGRTGHVISSLTLLILYVTSYPYMSFFWYPLSNIKRYRSPSSRFVLSSNQCFLCTFVPLCPFFSLLAPLKVAYVVKGGYCYNKCGKKYGPCEDYCGKNNFCCNKGKPGCEDKLRDMAPKGSRCVGWREGKLS